MFQKVRRHDANRIDPQRERLRDCHRPGGRTRAIEEAQIIRLSVEDQRAFAEAILNPSPPAIYTFAATSFPLTDLPPEKTKRLLRYGVLPAGLIGRLAVDQRFRGPRLGSALIIDAARRAAGADPAIFALVVDAKDHATVAFYEHLGFRRFVSRSLSFYMPIATALKAIQTAG